MKNHSNTRQRKAAEQQRKDDNPSTSSEVKSFTPPASGIQRFEDKRPETAVQKKQQEMISNSSQSKKTAQLKQADSKDKEEETKIKQLSAEKEKKQLKQDQNSAADQTKEAPQPSVGEKLPKDTKAQMETHFGADFSEVTIFKDSKQAKSLNALAFTQGNEIHFAPGQYDPSSDQGKKLLGHELTHVIQQREGRVKSSPQKKGSGGVSINDDKQLENEADKMGAQAGREAAVSSPSREEIQLKEGGAAVPGTGRKITSKKPQSIKTGTSVTYTLEQIGSELWSSDSKLTYHWTVQNSMGTPFIDKTTGGPYLNCTAANPGDYTISVEVLDNGVPVPGMKYEYTQNVFMEEKNTELGGLSVGNFDFKFDGKKIDVNVRVKFEFEDTIPEADHAGFKSKFLNAVRTSWGSNARMLEGTSDKGTKFDIPINIKATEVSDNSYHKVVEVTKDWRRPKVIDEINVYMGISENTIAHEFGHVLGLDDEYDGGWMENIMFWHDDGSHQTDTNALMNDGSEMRDRYFMLYKNAVESTAAKGYSYKIK